MPPRRKHENRDLSGILNLYCRNGYYSWRDPRTGKEHGLGRDKRQAISEASEANVWLKQQNVPRLIDKLNGERTIGAFIPRYKELLGDRDLADATRTARRTHLKAIEKGLGWVKVERSQEALAEVTGIVSGWLREYEKAGKNRMAKALRSTLVDFFASAASEGWVSVNPIKVLTIPKQLVRRSRLTLDQYLAMHEVAGQLHPWVRRSFELGIVSLQRREDIAPLQFSDIKEGRLHVEQQKTGVRLRIPMALRLHAVGLTLGDVIGQCRDTVLSRFLVHHTRSQGQAKKGEAVHPQTITAAFAEARKLAGITPSSPGSTPPTFHELRSLGARLYKDQGYDAQNLLGHKDQKTTALYHDNRGAEWIDVAA